MAGTERSLAYRDTSTDLMLSTSTSLTAAAAPVVDPLADLASTILK